MFLLASHVIWGFINGLQGVIRSLNLSGEGNRARCHISENGWKTIVRGRGVGVRCLLPGCGCGWLSIQDVWSVIDNCKITLLVSSRCVPAVIPPWELSSSALTHLMEIIASGVILQIKHIFYRREILIFPTIEDRSSARVPECICRCGASSDLSSSCATICNS